MIGRKISALVAMTGLAFGAGPVCGATPGFSVIELFQSQGCSSCPPANANVNAVAASRPDVLALSFSVDYWDRLGWKDTFASPAYTHRQEEYARGLHNAGIATPEVVINGRREVVGFNARELASVIAATPQPVTASLTGDRVEIAAGSAPASGADVWLVRYDPRVLNVPVKAGENTGKTLPHRNIVRELSRLGGWSGAAMSYTLPSAKLAGLRTAVLVQSRGGPILAAARD